MPHHWNHSERPHAVHTIDHMGSVAVKVVCTCVSMHMSVLECVSSCVMGYEGESGSINTPQISGAVKVRLLCAVPACLTSPSYYRAKHVLWPTLCDRIKNKFYYLEIILFLSLVNLFNKFSFSQVTPPPFYPRLWLRSPSNQIHVFTTKSQRIGRNGINGKP